MPLMRAFFVTLSAYIIIACAATAGGWRSQTVIHAWQHEQPGPPGFGPAEEDLVELDDGQVYEITKQPGLSSLYFMKPGARVDLYSAKSKEGRTYYSIRMTDLPHWGTVLWQVQLYKGNDAPISSPTPISNSLGPKAVAEYYDTADPHIVDVATAYLTRIVALGAAPFATSDDVVRGYHYVSCQKGRLDKLCSAYEVAIMEAIPAAILSSHEWLKTFGDGVESPAQQFLVNGHVMFFLNFGQAHSGGNGVDAVYDQERARVFGAVRINDQEQSDELAREPGSKMVYGNETAGFLPLRVYVFGITDSDEAAIFLDLFLHPDSHGSFDSNELRESIRKSEGNLSRAVAGSMGVP